MAGEAPESADPPPPTVAHRRPAGYPDLPAPGAVAPTASEPSGADAARDLAAVLGEGGATTPERFRAAERLIGAELTSAQLDRLLAALARPERFDDLRPGPRHGLLNELLKVFYLREPVHPRFVETLGGVIADSAQGEVVRDYYVQALSLAHPALDEPAAADAEAILRRSLAHEGTSLPGTALLGLGRIRRADPGTDPGRDAALLEAARGLFEEHADERSRIAAAQLLAGFRDAGSAAALAAAARDDRASAALRLAALHALRAVDPPAAEAALRAAATAEDPLLAGSAARLLSKTTDSHAR